MALTGSSLSLSESRVVDIRGLRFRSAPGALRDFGGPPAIIQNDAIQHNNIYNEMYKIYNEIYDKLYNNIIYIYIYIMYNNTYVYVYIYIYIYI